MLSKHKYLQPTTVTSWSGALLQGVDSVLPPLSSGSKFHTVRVRKPTVVPASESRGIRSLSVSWTAPNVTTDDPIGVAVWDTCSRTSYAVRRTRVSPLRPSLARKVTVLRKTGLLLFCRSKTRIITRCFDTCKHASSRDTLKVYLLLGINTSTDSFYLKIIFKI